MLLGIIIFATAVITPFVKEKSSGNKNIRKERQIVIKMATLDQLNEKVLPPPPPPPPPASRGDIAKQQKYVPPVVVDSIKPEDVKQIMTTEQAKTAVNSEDTTGVIEAKEDLLGVSPPEEAPFTSVEEMPVYPGGTPELMKFVSEHINYPETARENKIQGKVVVKFCITTKGSVNQVSVLSGVNPELNAEAVRVVNLLHGFEPGKQFGRPVPVWYVVPITFSLQ
jgi:protein TonB